ncbi:hypothetical protein CcaverHIS002_0302200 [Cutaneotrichosporon cavernicola]|nr:hypothetical protein CcaverHIS002_0302200 [Cutaneotrichosporon cavernicola]
MAAPVAEIDLKKPAPVAEVPKEEEKGLTNDIITKYTTAGQALAAALKKFTPEIAAGKKVLELCIAGDKHIADAVAPLYNKAKAGVKVSKGSAFPTCISVNNVVSHVSPLPSDPEYTLKDGDVVKVQLGVHIDGYAVVHAETIVIGSKVEGPTADVIAAAYDAAQAAMRTLKVGAKNWDVTEVVTKVAKEYETLPVQGMLSCNHEQNVTDGKKRILLNPTPELKREHESCTFEEGEVYGVDVLVVTGTDAKARPEDARTSVYKRANDVNYQLKMKTSRTTFSEIQKKAGAFPFTLRALEDEKRARMGVQEAVAHGLLKPYEVTQTPSGSIVAQFFFTLALMPAGPLLLSPRPHLVLCSAKGVKDEELKTLLAAPLRAPKKKAKKAAAEAKA